MIGSETRVLMAIQKYACHNSRIFSGEPGIISSGMEIRLKVKSKIGKKGVLIKREMATRIIQGDIAAKSVIFFSADISAKSILFRSMIGFRNNRKYSSMITITPLPAAIPVIVIKPNLLSPIQINPAVKPDMVAGINPLETILRPPTIHNIPRAIQVLITGIKRAK